MTNKMFAAALTVGTLLGTALPALAQPATDKVERVVVRPQPAPAPAPTSYEGPTLPAIDANGLLSNGLVAAGPTIG